MKKLSLFVCLLLATLFTNAYASENVQSLDKMIAVVNDDVITTSELKQALHVAKSQLASQNVPVPPEKTLKKQVLEQLINKKIQLQLASQSGVSVSKKELDKAIQQIAKQNQVSVKTLADKIKQSGMSMHEYRAEMHEQLLIQKLQRNQVAQNITISPDEVTTFMNSQVWHNNSAKEYRIEDILIPVADTPSPDDLSKAKSKALSVLSKLKSGTSFKSIAQSDSGKTDALQGGDLGWRNLPEIPSAFTAEINHMRKGEVAGPIQTPNGFHIIKLANVRKASSDKPKLNRDAVKNLLLQRKFEEAMLNWVSKLRSQAFVNVQPQTAWS